MNRRMDQMKSSLHESGLSTTAASMNTKKRLNSGGRRANSSKGKSKGNDNTNNDKDDDEAFLSLLSSQRQLLSQFSMEQKNKNSSLSSRRSPSSSTHQKSAIDEQDQQKQHQLQLELLFRQQQQQHSLTHEIESQQRRQQQHTTPQMGFIPPPNVQPSHFFSRRLSQQQQQQQHATQQHYQHVQNFLHMQQLLNMPTQGEQNQQPLQRQQLHQSGFGSMSKTGQEMLPPRQYAASVPFGSTVHHQNEQFSNRNDLLAAFGGGGGSGGGDVQSDPFSLMNRSIGDLQLDEKRRHSLDLLYSTRRLSMGLGDDDMIVDDFHPTKDLKGDLTGKTSYIVANKHKRRRSSFSLLSEAPVLFDYDPEEVARRLSISVSNIDQFHQSAESSNVVKKAGQNQNQENDVDEEQIHPSVRLDPNIDLQTLKDKIEVFASAMDKSIKSQQDIHDWDRKMGLKRSHSKTMRLSMRSRKKLRSTMKREMNTIYVIARSFLESENGDQKEACHRWH